MYINLESQVINPQIPPGLQVYLALVLQMLLQHIAQVLQKGTDPLMLWNSESASQGRGQKKGQSCLCMEAESSGNAVQMQSMKLLWGLTDDWKWW